MAMAMIMRKMMRMIRTNGNDVNKKSERLETERAHRRTLMYRRDLAYNHQALNFWPLTSRTSKMHCNDIW